MDQKYAVWRSKRTGALFITNYDPEDDGRDNLHEVVMITKSMARAQEICTYSPYHGEYAAWIEMMARRGSSECEKMIQNKGRPIPACLLNEEIPFAG